MMKMKSKNSTEVKKSRKPAPPAIYTVTDGDKIVWVGMLQEYEFSGMAEKDQPTTELLMTDHAKKYNLKLTKFYRRGKKMITTTLHDPRKSENMKFGRVNQGKHTGKKCRYVIYTDSDGKKYTFYLSPVRGNCQFDLSGVLAHKHEIEFRRKRGRGLNPGIGVAPTKTRYLL